LKSSNSSDVLQFWKKHIATNLSFQKWQMQFARQQTQPAANVFSVRVVFNDRRCSGVLFRRNFVPKLS